MAHAIVRVGYTQYVMPVETAVTVAQALADAEQYKTVYIPQESRSDPNINSTVHIWSPTDHSENLTLELLNDDVYRLAKMAGKPDK